MNDFNLELKLKAIQVPERTEDYWEDFPSRVRRQLARSVRDERVCWRSRPQRGWNSSLALACVLLFLSLMPVFHVAFNGERILQREAERLPRGMHALMADQHGMQNLITDSQ